MTHAIRIAELAELPPGKGKVFDLGEVQVTVYNVDGRYRATASRRPRAPHRAGELAECAPHGLIFDVFAEDSPATLRTGDQDCRVHDDGRSIYVELSS